MAIPLLHMLCHTYSLLGVNCGAFYPLAPPIAHTLRNTTLISLSVQSYTRYYQNYKKKYIRKLHKYT